MKIVFAQWFAAFTVVVFSSISQAQFVNGSFEDPSLPLGSFTTDGIDGWSHTGTAGVWHADAFTDPIPDGTQVGYVNFGGAVAQVSTALLTEGDNTVSFWAGRRIDGLEGQMLVEMWGGGTASGGGIIGGTPIGFDIINATDVAVGAFQQFTITKSLLAGDPLIGQAIGLRFAIISGSQVDFDKVQVVPEPISMIAFAGGAFALRRRKR